MTEKQNKAWKLDYNIIMTVVFLVILGTILHCSSGKGYTDFFKQLIFIAIGFVLIYFIQLKPYKCLKLPPLFWYILSAAVLMLLFIPGLRYSSHGATRWLQIFGITIQVAEIVKCFMIIYLADILSEHVFALNTVRGVFTVWVYVGIIAAMILGISSNLSSCLILLMITFCITFLAGNTKKFHLIVLASAAVLVVILCIILKLNLPDQSKLESIKDSFYQLARVIVWLEPEKYDDGYQLLQGVYAIGSGGLFGCGLGKSVQRTMLPEASNDMIFCILAEELGFFGVVVLLFLYGYLLYQIFLVASNARSRFGRLLCIGILFHLAFQVIVNIAVATMLTPNTGVSLPFISYGGSALIMYFIQIGIVLNVYRYDILKKQKK